MHDILHSTIMLIDKIETLKGQIEKMKADNEAMLEELRIKYLSKKGEVAALFNEFKTVAPEQKREMGQRLNELKNLATERINLLKENFKAQEKEKNKIDITRPAFPAQQGTGHPISVVRKQIIDIFSRLGFTLADGPEVEDDWHVFSALNFAPDHPARDMQDTFFIEQNSDDVTRNIVLRSHTSSVQVRTMESKQPPIRIICPGRVYRNEAITARAHCFFHHIDTKIRLRPSYFPFTEPSAEMDVSCMLCGGEGCGFCKHTGWVEILGCGMVDPNVLEASGIDSKVYTGYAFGLGIERITNLKYMVKDLRMFSENDVRFLNEFKSAH